MKKNLIKGNSKLILSCLVVVCTCGGIYAIRSSYVNAQNKKIEVEKAEKEAVKLAQIQEKKDFVAKNKIAYLTFDDGPHHTNTREILSILDKNNIKASFFLVGDMVEKRQDIVKQMYNSGHTLANHTMTHSYTYTPELLLNDIKSNEQAINKAVGKDISHKFVRIPGGGHGKTALKEALSKNGYVNTDWSALSGDTEKGGKNNKEHIIKRIEETVGDDQYEVILMHDSKSITKDTLQSVIDSIKAKGYTFMPLDEYTPTSSKSF